MSESEIVARSVSRVTGTQKASAPGTPPIDTQPTLEHLLRVIPLAQTGTDGALTLTLLALEVYADGCVVTYQLLERVAALTTGRFPEIEIRGQDDVGGRYGGLSMGAGGGGDQHMLRWRGTQRLAPTLDPNAKELTLEVWIGWRANDAPLGTRFKSPSAEGDPWVFVVPIG